MKKLYMQKMWKNFKALTSVTMLVLLVTQANATHIVGGNITYRCVAKDIYEVTMVVRRDCYNGDPEAFFDDPASIGIFDRTGELMQGLGTKGQLLLKLNQNDTLESIMENLCSLDGVNSVCIHETTTEELSFYLSDQAVITSCIRDVVAMYPSRISKNH